MRPVLHGDLSSAARALLAVPPAARAGLCARLLEQAEQADAFRLRNGRLHPRWGNGSLMAAARRQPLADEPGLDDPDYCRCVAMVLRALIARRAGRGGEGAGADQRC
ncbi:MAG: hypothetical protein AB7S99_03670 [Pseudodonghicola sp.]